MMPAMADTPPLAHPDDTVLRAFALAPAPLTPASSGLINRTWHVRGVRGEPLVLQRVNAMFAPRIHEDIVAVTRHLAAKGLVTPELVPTTNGAHWLEHGGAVWRVLTEVPGISRDALESPGQAAEAGRALAAFHRAMADLEHEFAGTRLGVHDTARHLRNLERALEEHTAHRELAANRPIAAAVLDLGATLPPMPRAPDRIEHGDPKISNVIFSYAYRALSFVDLDTLGRMPVALELGDALRSWCNPRPEDAADGRFSPELFAAAVAGYAGGAAGLLEEAEWRPIPAATLTITVELAARFCADALHERYFGWDARRYASASAHNQARTRGQLRLAQQLRTELPTLEQVTANAFAH
jgi:Ser/Thr protein kinase RdoA (MazF antagonist)